MTRLWVWVRNKPSVFTMSQKIKEATSLFLKNWQLFSLITLTVWLPGAILLVYLRLYVFPGSTGGDEFQILTQELRISNLIELAGGPFYIGALIYAASRLKQGLSITYSEAMEHASKRSFKFLMTRISTGLILLVGTLAFIIPGIVLALRFALIGPVVVLEGIDGQKARTRSAQLTQGKRWNILGTLILTFLGAFIAATLALFVLYIPLALVGQEENFIVAVITECVISVLFTLPTLVLFLFYWDAKGQDVEDGEPDASEIVG